MAHKRYKAAMSIKGLGSSATKGFTCIHLSLQRSQQGGERWAEYRALSSNALRSAHF